MEYPGKVDPITPCIDVYKAKIKSDGVLKKLRFIIALRGDLRNK